MIPNFTFGIITDGKNPSQVDESIKKIALDRIDFGIKNKIELDIEIIVVGDYTPGYQMPPWVRIIPFDASIKPMWITRKKNIIAQEAKNDIIVFMHDYVHIEPGFFQGWFDFNQDFDVAVNRILTLEGHRHSDWVVDVYLLWETFPELRNHWNVSLGYKFKGLSKIQYISGNYWLAKKQFMLENPLNEDLIWGQAEDIEWSKRIREKTEFTINTKSTVRLNKPNKWAPGMLDVKYVSQLIDNHKLSLRYE